MPCQSSEYEPEYNVLRCTCGDRVIATYRPECPHCYYTHNGIEQVMPPHRTNLMMLCEHLCETMFNTDENEDYGFGVPTQETVNGYRRNPAVCVEFDNFKVCVDFTDTEVSREQINNFDFNQCNIPAYYINVVGLRWNANNIDEHVFDVVTSIYQAYDNNTCGNEIMDFHEEYISHEEEDEPQPK